MLMSKFFGGLNNKLDPTIIDDNQSVVSENIDIISGVIKSLNEKKLQEDVEVTDMQPFYFKGNWNFHHQYTSYARLLSVVFRAYDDKLEKSLDNITWDNLWIVPPETAPDVTQGELYEQDDDSAYGFYGDEIYYCYTYYNENDGTESAPSPIAPSIKIGEAVEDGSDEAQLKGRALVTVKASSDKQVTTINIYRLGGGISSFTLSKQIANISAQVVDDTANDSLDTTLETTGYVSPPEVSYICSYYAMLIGVGVGNSNVVYYSDEANPMVWNPLNYIVFDEDIVGLGASQLGLLVFTSYRVYIIYGTTSTEFQRYLLFDNIGCKSHQSIQSYKGSVIWQGDDGFYIFDGNDCTNLTLSTIDTLEGTVISSCFCKQIYYGVLDDGNIITIDFRINGYPVTYITGQTATGIFAAENEVFIVDDLKLYSLHGSDEYRTLKWKSKQYSNNEQTTCKNYKYIYVYCEGEFILRLYVDGILANEVELKSGINCLQSSSQHRLGYNIQFEFEGKGKVIAFDYSSEARQTSKGV